jgi:hypothetical protein
MTVNFADEMYPHIMQGSWTGRIYLQHWADSFTSNPKEVVLRIFIILKNTSSPAGIAAANLWYSDKHDNY